MKRLSYNTDLSNLNLNVGYGVAGYNIVKSLQALGYEVPFSDETAPVEMFFCQPEYWEFSNDNQYKIGYWPWESTKMPDSWYWHIDQADELWTTSPWCQKILGADLGREFKLYEHGIDHSWVPLQRKPSSKVRFLHVGEPAPRKAGQMALDAFREAFGDSEDVHLTIKAHNFSTVRVYDRYKSIICNPEDLKNVSVITENVEEGAMQSLYYMHDVLVYPSYGEGFGLIPLQALASGMPTICTSEWAPYKRFLGDLGLSSRYIDSPWEAEHPGKVLEPSFDELVQTMIDTKNNIDDYTHMFYHQAASVHEYYDWINLTKNAFAHLDEKF